MILKKEEKIVAMLVHLKNQQRNKRIIISLDKKIKIAIISRIIIRLQRKVLIISSSQQAIIRIVI